MNEANQNRIAKIALKANIVSSAAMKKGVRPVLGEGKAKSRNSGSNVFKTVAVDLYQKADSRLEDTKRREEKKAERGTTGSGMERRGTAGGGEREVPEVVCNLMKG